MKQAYVDIKGVKTKITTYGKWIEESITPNENIVIIIPGNPGVNSFYNEFAKKIYDRTGYAVWCVGHAGHNNPQNSIAPIPKLKGNEHIFGLKGQVEHKVEFFEKYVPNNAKIHLIGHSIGCYLILELLEHSLIKEKVTDVKLLFPTIENMEISSNGYFLTKFVKPFVPLIVFLSWIFRALPMFIQAVLLNIYLFITGIHSINFIPILQLIHPDILEKVFFLAFEEMDMVKTRNDNAIKNNIQKIRLLYGEYDGWAPKSYYDKLKLDIPNVNAVLTSYDHAFVLRESAALGDRVCDWFSTN